MNDSGLWLGLGLLDSLPSCPIEESRVISIATLGTFTVGSIRGIGCLGGLEELSWLTNIRLLLPSSLLTGEGVVFSSLWLMCVRVYVKNK